MLKGREITVLGAGVAGLSAALALSARGARVRVLEQAPEIAEVGAGLQISPNGVAVLEALGLGGQARALAVENRAVHLKDYREGISVVRLDLARDAPGQRFLLFHRADLIGLLADAVRRAGIAVELGRVVQEVHEDDRGVGLRFSDGSEEEVAFLVGADGLHSCLRRHLEGPARPFFTGQVAWRAVVPAPQGMAPEAVVYMAPGRHLVTYPLREGRLANIVAVEERRTWVEEGWSQRGDAGEMRRLFGDFAPPVRQLLQRVETVHLWGLFRHPVARRWHGARSVLAGDAAHPTLPFLAQGANMALEDAWVLAACLDAASPPEALAAYQARRLPRVARVIAAANANARNYHLRNPLARFAAHSALRLAGALAPGRMLSRFNWIWQHDVTRG